MAKVVYSSRYNIGFFGVERLHPFDSRKYGRAWRLLRQREGKLLRSAHVPVDRPASFSELLLGHSAEYLGRIRQSGPLAAALELPPLARAPAWLLRWRVVKPMLWAVRGTELAFRAALDHGVAINLSGGYHHAKRTKGEGFCLFSDIAIAVRSLRQAGQLHDSSRIAYIDLDAHQGNGVCHQFVDDASVFIFDAYNREIYPGYDEIAQDRIDCKVALRSNTSGGEYLARLKEKLPGFLDGISRSSPIELAIYNAGTDVIADDPLGGLALAAEDVLERDLYVIDLLRRRGIPVAMLTSGGYTRDSYRLIAATVEQLLQR